MRTRTLITLAVGVIACGGLVPFAGRARPGCPPSYAAASEAGFSSERLASLDVLIEADVAAGFPGAVLLIMRHGSIVKEQAYGYRRKFANGGELLPEDKFEPMQVETLFDLASNSKMYATNYAVMKLVHEGRLDIDAPIQQYIPQYAGGVRDSITPRDILTHSAGYAPEVMFFRPDNELGEAFYSQERERTEQLILTKVPFEYERGTGSLYSDTDYMLAGILVERITGRRLDEYVEEEIYAALGLSKTLYNPLQKGFMPSQVAATETQGNTRDGRLSFPNVRTHVLQGEVHDEKTFYTMGGVAGHAGLFSTARELGMLANLMLSEGRCCDRQFFDQGVIDHFVAASEENPAFGIGWQRAAGERSHWIFGDHASPKAFGHVGWTGTLTVIDPQYDLVIVLLTNQKHSPVQEGRRRLYFEGDRFPTSHFGQTVTRIYEALEDVQAD